MKNETLPSQPITRRDFLKTSAVAASAAAVGTVQLGVHAAGSDIIKVGMIGCGGRNSGAAAQALSADPGARLVAMCDIFRDRIEKAREAVKQANGAQVTVDGDTRPLPRPFLVLATQNPIELEGTFPLPEAQIDRFFIKLPIGYPTVDEENSILLRFERTDPLMGLSPVVSTDDLLAMQKQVCEIRVEASVRGYVVAIARATREHSEVALGASPRGTMALYHAAQAWAAIRGRAFVVPDDVKRLAPYVLTHRILIQPQVRLRGRKPEEIVSEIVDTVPVPVVS